MLLEETGWAWGFQGETQPPRDVTKFSACFCAGGAVALGAGGEGCAGGAAAHMRSWGTGEGRGPRVSPPRHPAWDPPASD